MYTITTATSTYTPADTDVVHYTSASLTDRRQPMPVHLLQYDHTVPIIAVELNANGAPYTVPSGAAVNVRLEKPDGTYVYNPAYGLSDDRQTVYIAVTVQMTTVSGTLSPVVEIVIGGGVAATGNFSMIVDPNPVPESAIESTDEYKTIQQLANDVTVATEILRKNEQAIQDIRENIDAIKNAPMQAAAAASSAAQARQYAESIDPDSFVKASTLLDLVYPVGSVYISYNSASPAALFGGSWTQIQGRFLLAADSTYPAGSTGGEATHTLTVSEMPSHNHTLNASYSSAGSSSSVESKMLAGDDNNGWLWDYSATNNTGDGAAHNNMPPYLAVYMWWRTA